MSRQSPDPSLLEPGDLSLLARFERCELTPPELDHATHVRIAWVCLHLAPTAQAVGRIAAGLAAFAAHHGAADHFHETITWAYVLLVNERIARFGRVHGWQEFAAANPDLLAGGKSALGALYHEETLGSDLARRVFVLPDRLAAAGAGRGAR